MPTLTPTQQLDSIITLFDHILNDCEDDDTRSAAFGMFLDATVDKLANGRTPQGLTTVEMTLMMLLGQVLIHFPGSAITIMLRHTLDSLRELRAGASEDFALTTHLH